MKKTAFLFPGQGSQAVGMGLDLFQEYDTVRELFDMVEEITKINISRLCFKGPFDNLTETINLQPAITTVNLACLIAIQKEDIQPDISAGHSLGEYSAMCASGIISKAETFTIVHQRGILMHRESTKHQGAMHAILGLSITDIEELVAEVKTGGVVAVANHNTEKQVVVTGTPESVKKISSLAASRGGKAVPLKVSGAWHSELMREAQEEFKHVLDDVSFRPPEIPVVFNVTADAATDVVDIKSIMVRQLCSPVKWYDSMNKLTEENVEVFVEVGPGKVLTGLLKKILPKEYPGKVYSVSDMKSLERFLKDAT